MFKYTIKRVLQSLLTVLIVVSIVSLLLSLMPTDYYFTEDELMKLTDEQKNAILSAAGLLDNPFEQLFHFLKNLFLHGDLGVSRRIQAGVPVLTVIGGKFGISMKMGSIALVISLLLGVPMGILQAKYKNGAFDNAGTVYTIFVNAVPSLVSYSLVLVLGVKVFGLPSMYSTRQALRSSIMPVICLALGSIASYALWMRRYMIDELTKDYIKLAKIKGLSSRTIMFRHVLRNAFVPMAQNLPSSFMLTISGSLLVERFFSVPGMGPLLTDAITRYDLIALFIGQSFWVMCASIIFFHWMYMAKNVRNLVFIYRDREYNLASRCLGTRLSRVLTRNILPYLISVIILRVALSIPSTIGLETTLSYLGLGLEINIPSLGILLRNSRAFFLDYPYLLIFPAVIVSLVTITFYLAGNAFSDAADPRNHV